MPIPFLLAGLGIAAGVIGAGGHISAKETNEKAQQLADEAKDIYESEKYKLERTKSSTEKSLLTLGYEKKNVLDTSMNQFLYVYDKIKHIEMSESIGLDEISKFTFDEQKAIEIRQMSDIYSNTIKSGATGAATGAVVALAASGALPIVTTGLTTAGSALMAGEIGAAAGIAGSTLSFGAAMTPLAAVAAPVILFTGISASIKADENLEKANTMYAEAEAAVEQMRVSETLCIAISERSDMFDKLLVELDKKFAQCTGFLEEMIRKKEGRIFKKTLTIADFTKSELELIAVTRSLAGAVKVVIDTPILSKDGKVSAATEEIYDTTMDVISTNGSKADSLMTQIANETRQKEMQTANNQNQYTMLQTRTEGTVQQQMINSAQKSSSITVMGASRNVFAVVLGVLLACILSSNIADSISSLQDNFLFMDADTANSIAIWLFICSLIIMFVGKFQKKTVNKICGGASGIALFVLYVQYCRSMEMIDHNVIIPITLFIGLSIAGNFLYSKSENFGFIRFISLEMICGALWQIGFIVYMIFVDLLDFSGAFILILTAVFMLLVSLLTMIMMQGDF